MNSKASSDSSSRTHSKSKGFILTIVNVICAAFVMFVLCRVYPRTENLSFDYLGVIIGVLSILVTILIGWQINSTLTVKAEMKDFKDEISLSAAQLEINNRKTQIGLYSTMFQEKLKSSDIYGCFTYGLWTLVYCIPFKEQHEFCKVVIKALLEKSSGHKFSSTEKAELISISHNINNSWLSGDYAPLFHLLINKM